MTTNTFETKTYNGISIIINTNDGYVNASQMCSSNKRQWRHYKNTKSWNQVKEAFEKRYSNVGGRILPPSYYMEKVEKEYQGEYIHPKLVHFVAEYCSVEYAFMVAELMDSINDKVHEKLDENKLDDTVENAKPIFNNIVHQIASVDKSSFEEQFCYGCRDSIHKLDSYEQMDLKRDIVEYNSIKERLNVVEKKIDEWGVFVKQYYPDFMK